MVTSASTGRLAVSPALISTTDAPGFRNAVHVASSARRRLFPALRPASRHRYRAGERATSACHGHSAWPVSTLLKVSGFFPAPTDSLQVHAWLRNGSLPVAGSLLVAVTAGSILRCR